ncbi:MAG: hypothetical protein A2339_01625 [Elusimicrobia bacterium RIFOXYB12_FULL_50_12]|nr:MAG: hypothetical protein A2339_01625 [Elusimicrobia bacterium RIFOXYB12_FULL_50_12]
MPPKTHFENLISPLVLGTLVQKLFAVFQKTELEIVLLETWLSEPMKPANELAVQFRTIQPSTILLSQLFPVEKKFDPNHISFGWA